MSRTLTFDRIHAGLTKLANLGILEELVDVAGTTVGLRTLTPAEHRKVLQYARDYMERYSDSGEDFALEAAMDFLTIRKVESLAHAIYQLGDIDFRGVDYIETGERSETGYPVKVEKHVFVRALVEDMDLSLVDALHHKYSDLLQLSEENATKSIKFRDPAEELAVLEVRRKELRQSLGIKDEDTETPAPEPSQESTQQNTNVRSEIFKPLSEDEKADKIRERYVQSQSEESEPQHEHSPPSLDVGGQKFIRLDDPETPYSEDEQRYFEEQEQLFHERGMVAKPSETSKPSEAQEALDHRRRRSPLNQVPPKILEGQLPQSGHTPTSGTLKKSDTDDIEMAEGISSADIGYLGSPENQGMPRTPLNPSPQQGTGNPNFKGHK